MNFRNVLISLSLSIILAQSLYSQQLNLADSIKDRTTNVSAEEFRIYPLNDTREMIKFKSSLTLFGNDLINSGLFLSGESFSIDGMNVRGMDYLPTIWSSDIGINTEFGTNVSAYSPVGKYDFRTIPLSDGKFFNAEFRSSIHSIKSSIVFTEKISKHKDDSKPIEIFLSGSSRLNFDGGPSFVDNVSMSQPTEDALSVSPLYQQQNWLVDYITEVTGAEGLEANTYVRNTQQRDLKLYGKIKIPISGTMNFNVQSLYSAEKGKIDVFENRLFNYMNNPDYRKNYFDGRITFDHVAVDKENLKLKYQLGAGYDNEWSKQENAKFGNDFFKYSYIGSYTQYKEKVYEGYSTGDHFTYVMNGFATTGVDFTPGSLNPGLVNYINPIWASGLHEPYALLNFQNGYIPENTSAGWSNYNVPVTYYSQQQSSRINIFGSSDVETGNSKLSFGFDYRNDIYRNSGMNAARLYPLMRDELNSHINQLDLDHPMEEIIDGNTYITYNRLYNGEDQTEFDRNLRIKLGLPVDGTDYILIDSYNYDDNTIKYYDQNSQLQTLQLTNSLLSVDLFSPEELLEISTVSGYDVYGNKVSHSHDVYSIAEDGAAIPYSPTNIAAWLNYKHEKGPFRFEGGIRFERFDARQPVLADPLSFYSIYSVAESPQFNHSASAHPGWLVYLDPSDLSKVEGYREGDQWFTPEGKKWSLDSFEDIRPFFKNPGDFGLRNMNFADYKPVINILPSISLTYNIGSSFYTQLVYNSYTRNPYLNTYDAYSYLQFPYDGRSILQNPGLKPERFDKAQFDFGYFGRKGLSVNISGGMMWYSNAIQLVRISYAYPRSYSTYGNSSNTISIPTTGLKINYRHYWWEGGLNYVHTFVEKEMSVKDISEKSNLSIYMTTSRDVAGFYGALKFHQTLEGLSLSGTWQYRGGTPYLVTKSVFMTGATERIKASNELDCKLLYSMNIDREEIQMDFYIQVLNVFNTQTIYKVYGNTGQPDDNGYLSDPSNQAIINSHADPQAFIDQYKLKINRPEFYSQARSVWIGVSISF